MTATMHISLPEALKEYVQRRVLEGNFSNPSDFVRALIRFDQEREEERRVEQLLLDGLASGEAQLLTKEDWDYIRSEVRARLGKKQLA